MYFVVFPSRDYAVGALGGVLASTVSVLAAHPIESAKVRLQSGERLGLGGGGGAASLWGRLLALLQRPYCGIGPHLLQYSALNFVRFGSFAAAKSYFEGRRGGGAPLPLADIFASGAFSGACIAALLHPLWVLKTHQQANRLDAVQASSRLWHGEGVRGFFRGYVSGFARFPLALGVFFASYEALKRGADGTLGGAPAAAAAAPPSRAEGGAAQAAVEVPGRASASEMALQLAGRAGSGAVAGVLCWTSIFPLDVVQSRMMGEATYGGGRVYYSAFSSFRHVYRTEGISSFARGYSAVLLRSGPVNAILLPVSDALQPVVDRWLPP